MHVFTKRYACIWYRWKQGNLQKHYLISMYDCDIVYLWQCAFKFHTWSVIIVITGTGLLLGWKEMWEWTLLPVLHGFEIWNGVKCIPQLRKMSKFDQCLEKSNPIPSFEEETEIFEVQTGKIRKHQKEIYEESILTYKRSGNVHIQKRTPRS